MCSIIPKYQQMGKKYRKKAKSPFLLDLHARRAAHVTRAQNTNKWAISMEGQSYEKAIAGTYSTLQVTPLQ